MPELRSFWASSCTLAETWRKVRGPCVVARLEASRIGWTFVGTCGMMITTDLGATLSLAATPPVVIAAEALAAFRRRRERDLAAAWMPPLVERRSEGTVIPDPKTWRLAAEPLRRILRSTKVNAFDKGVVGSAACNAIWTRDRLVRSGLALNVLCPLCALMPDTIHHRLYWCTSEDAERMRTEHFTPELLARARAEGPSSMLFGRGWMEHPTEEWPQAAQGLDDPRRERVAADGTWDEVSGDDGNWQLQGLVYQDGSCAPHVLSELARASWGVVQVTEEGLPEYRVFGPAPGALRQTAHTGEWCAYNALCTLATGSCVGHQDCDGVVKELVKPLHLRLRQSSKGAGFCREVQSLPGHALVEEVLKVKAHTQVASVAHDPLLLRHHKANDSADLAAKKALGLHPQPGAAIAQRVEEDLKAVKAFAKLAAAILPLWPKIPKEEIKAARAGPRARRRAQAAAGPRHCWLDLGTHAQCAYCLARIWSRRGRLARDREGCSGNSGRMMDILLRPQGHALLLGEVEGLPIAACLRCGAYATCKPQDLAAECKGRLTARGRKNLNFLQEGRHPNNPTGLTGRGEGLWMVADRRSLPRQALLCEASRSGRERRPLEGAATGPGDGVAERGGPTAAAAKLEALRARLAQRRLSQREEAQGEAGAGSTSASTETPPSS